VFISSGVAALRDTEKHAKQAAPIVEPVLDRASGVLPMDQPPPTTTLVRIDASVKIGAGVLLALGKAPRLAATALAGSLVPTTLARHRFWEETDPVERTNQQVHFLQNVGLLGGLLLASADTEGKPSLAWRAKRAGRTSAATAELFHRDVTEGLGTLGKRAGGIAEQAGERAGKYREIASDRAEKAAEVARERGGEGAEWARQRGLERAGQARDLAEIARQRGLERAEQARQQAEVVRKRGRKQAKRTRKQLAKRAQEARVRAQKTARKAKKNARKTARAK
jgi:uncharacterized membrane protein YphA (DoxX/SURF4 family)